MPIHFRRIAHCLLTSIAIICAGCANNQALGTTAANEKKNSAIEASSALQLSDISLPSDARLDAEKSLVMGSGDRWLGRLVVKSEVSSVQAYNHLLNGMPGIGWSLVTAVQSRVSLLTFQRSDRVASIQIEPAMFSGVTIAITLSPRQASAGENKSSR